MIKNKKDGVGYSTVIQCSVVHRSLAFIAPCSCFVLRSIVRSLDSIHFALSIPHTHTSHTFLFSRIYDTDTVPNYSSKTSAFLAVLPFHLLICTLGNAVLPVLCDKQSFTETAVPFFHIFPGVQTIGYVAISLSTGLGALLATLQYEKKVSMNFASFWNIMLLLFFQLDGIKFMYNLNKYPNRFDHSDYFTTYTPHLQSIWHTNELLLIGTILALTIGLKNLSDHVLAATASAASAAADAVAASAATTTNNALELAAKYGSNEIEFSSLYGNIEDMHE